MLWVKGGEDHKHPSVTTLVLMLPMNFLESFDMPLTIQMLNDSSAEQWLVDCCRQLKLRLLPSDCNDVGCLWNAELISQIFLKPSDVENTSGLFLYVSAQHVILTFF